MIPATRHAIPMPATANLFMFLPPGEFLVEHPCVLELNQLIQGEILKSMALGALNERGVDALVAHASELIQRHLVIAGLADALDVIRAEAAVFEPDELFQRRIRIAGRPDLLDEFRVYS